MAAKKTAKKKAGDISKQVYKFQEGITAIALEVAGYPIDEVHWPTSNRPNGVTVDVDVLIGPSEEGAHTNVGLKHVAAAKDGTHAAWRMMRELLDTKANGAPNFRIFSVVFDDAINTDWGVILSQFYDGHLSLPSRSEYGPNLIEVAFEYTRTILHGRTDADCRELLCLACDPCASSYDPHLKGLVCRYAEDLKKLLATKRSDLGSFWCDLHEFCIRDLPAIEPRLTSFRRGMAKFLIFRPEDRAKVYDAKLGTEVLQGSVDTFLADLGLISEQAEGDYVCDEDILNMLRLFQTKDADFFEEIIRDAPIEEIEDKFVTPLRGVRNVTSYYEYLIRNYEILTQADSMERALVACFHSPDVMLEDFPTEGKETTVWIFNVLVAVMKSAGGTRQSSGLNTLAERTGIKKISDGGFLVAPYVYRKKMLPDHVLKKVAEVFADSLRTIGKEGVGELEESAKDNFVRSIIEARLIPYKGFDPIGTLVKLALTEEGLKYAQHARFRTCAAELSGTSTGARVKVLEVFGEPPSFVLWQAPNRNARDKAKEFSAIVACLRWAWDTEKFIPRGHRVFMVIDGIWDQEDIDSLLRFGCEHVYYPDELDQLISTIAGKVSKKVIPIPDWDRLPQAAETDPTPKLKKKGNGK